MKNFVNVENIIGTDDLDDDLVNEINEFGNDVDALLNEGELQE